MAILGAHQSIAGGFHRAVERAAEVGCDCVQVFTKNCNQWRSKPISPAEAREFCRALQGLNISHPLAHDSYLINLATPDGVLWKKSIDAFVHELQRAETLGIPYVVTHPGAYTSASLVYGISRVAQALDEVHCQTPGLRAQCLLETTAGQGTSLGWQFEQLAEILHQAKDPDRLGVCVDTCHIFAAGYPLGTAKDYRATIKALDITVGLDRIKAFHLNDCRRECGSRVDRHAAIGRGMIGLEAFRRLVNDRRFHKVPMYLETPKGKENGIDLDVVNLRALRGLVR